jgi:hypothetical protein
MAFIFKIGQISPYGHAGSSGKHFFKLFDCYFSIIVDIFLDYISSCIVHSLSLPYYGDNTINVKILQGLNIKEQKCGVFLYFRFPKLARIIQQEGFYILGYHRVPV